MRRCKNKNFEDFKYVDYNEEANTYHINFSDELTKQFTLKLQNKTLKFSQLDFIFPPTNNHIFFIKEVFVYDIIIDQTDCHPTQQVTFETHYNMNNNKDNKKFYQILNILEKSILEKRKISIPESPREAETEKPNLNEGTYVEVYNPEEAIYMDLPGSERGSENGSESDKLTSGGKKRHRNTRRKKKTRRQKKRKTYKKY